ncbi:MAG: hypothetical protein V3U82_06275 [Robiginitomaculum sp.]
MITSKLLNCLLLMCMTHLAAGAADHAIGKAFGLTGRYGSVEDEHIAVIDVF